MLSRILNIWVIKERTKPLVSAKKSTKPTQPAKPKKGKSQQPQQQEPDHKGRRLHKRARPNSGLYAASAADDTAGSDTDMPLSDSDLEAPSSPPSSPPPPPPPRLTMLLIDLPDGSNVALRGMLDDLAAITADAWLRAKTSAQGYLEAAAKLLVYLVAALSGNQTQAGALVSLLLLLLSAGLLALSNSHARGLRMKGRVAAPYTSPPPPPLAGQAEGAEANGTKGDPPYPPGPSGATTSWPGSSNVSGIAALDDWAEKGQVGRPLQHSYPFDSIDYS